MTESWVQTLSIIGAAVAVTVSGVLSLWKILGKRVDDANEVSKTAHEGIGKRIDSVDRRIDDMGSNLRMLTNHLLHRQRVQNEELLDM